jgi:4-hydroxybenzoate polyprenyltransferase
MRPAQWSKNLLLLVPLFTSHMFHAAALGRVALALVAFSLVASATYVLNDLRDVQADRRHPWKRFRPFAAGDLSPRQGIVGIAVLLVIGLVLAGLVSPLFLLTVLAYLALTVAYSAFLKAYVLVDVFLLAGLYAMRIIAGAAAIGTAVSPWLLAFSSFLFFSLALVKRYAELAGLAQRGEADTAGRDYHVADNAMLRTMGIASGYLAVLVLAQFINTPPVKEKYDYPNVLGLLCPAVLYWISRLWMKTARGQMHEDPILYCIKDPTTWLVVAAMIVITLVAI